MTDELEPAALTDEQRRKFLQALSDDKTLGIRPALRAAGVKGSGGQLRALYRADEDLQEQARLARGWNINRVEGVAWDVAQNPEHPSWDRANARILKAYHPAFRDRVEVEHSGDPARPVQIEGARVTGLSEVFELARQFGIGIAAGAREGLGTSDARGALPAAPDVLPDPPDGQ